MRKFRLELKKYGSFDEIKIEDAFDAGFTALAYIDSIMYFVGNPDTVAFEETDPDSLRCYFNGIGELVRGLSSIAIGHFDQVETERRDLQRLVDYLKEKQLEIDIKSLIEELKGKQQN